MKEFAESKTSFDLIIENCSEGIILVNSRGNIEYANKSAKTLFKYNSLSGINVSRLMPERFRKKHSIIVDSFFKYPSKRQMGSGVTLYGLASDGSEFPVEIGINFMEEGGLKKVVLSIVDISERLEYENKLKDYYSKLQLSFKETQYQKKLLAVSEEKYKSIISNMDDIYYRTDINQNIVLISPSALKYYDLESADDFIGLNVADTFYYNPDERVKLLEALKANNGFVSNYEILLRSKGDVPVCFATNSHFVIDEKGKICGVEGILRDITDKKNTEKIQKENADKIAFAYEHIRDSISYAKTIQQSMLPKQEFLNVVFKNHFILFEPKDNISGDFYYANQIDNNLYFAVGDCTGHGVPGSLITMLVMNTLHSILGNFSNPSYVLEELRIRIKDAFKTLGNDNPNGCDIALCFYNKVTGKLLYSGAFLPLFIVRDNDTIIHEPNRNPIGHYMLEKPFFTTEIDIEKDDKIYMFSDGYQDQFDKTDTRKLGRKNFYKLLLETSKYDMDDQFLYLNTFFQDRKPVGEQTDDVTVMGIQLDR